MAEHIAYLKQVVNMTLPAILHDYQITVKQRRAAIVKLRQKTQEGSSHAQDYTAETSSAMLAHHQTLVAQQNIQILTTFITDLRREDGIEQGTRRKFHRVFVQCTDSTVNYRRLGWIVSADVEHCMICYQPFESVLRSHKHHCRACGNVICHHCSEHKEVVEGIEVLGPVRVCHLCNYGQVSRCYNIYHVMFIHYLSCVCMCVL